jgi:hypothetical protein
VRSDRGTRTVFQWAFGVRLDGPPEAVSSRGRKMKIFVGAAIAGLAVMAGCSETSEGDGGRTSTNDCASLAQVICQRRSDCFSYNMQSYWGGVATCAARTKLGCEANLAAPGATATPEQFAACAAAFASRRCEDWALNSTPVECEFPGTRDDGEACAFDSQCKSTYCPASDDTCSACAPHLAAGESCLATRACGWGFICYNGVCVQVAAIGGACTSSYQCGGYLNCEDGVCAEGPGSGEPCDPQVGLYCNGSQVLYCDPTANVCTPGTFAEVGEPCGWVNGEFVACTGSMCVGMGSDNPGTCTKHLADGAPCTDWGQNCFEPARCVNGACTLPDPNVCP